MPSVLIVDDDPSIRKLVATTLEDVAGFELVEAADGDEALELAGQQPPAIVLLDIDMPGIDGLEASRPRRDRPVARRAPRGGGAGARPAQGGVAHRRPG